MSFLPANYEPPVSTGGNYMKLQQGQNNFRILSKPILGWELWINGHPQRYTLDNRPEGNDESKPREFWSMIVWNYAEEKIQILHVTQGSIKKSIRDLSLDENWGCPSDYDLKITKTGQQLKTNYSVTPTPKTAVKDHIKQAFKSFPCLLEALFVNDDPFAPHSNKTPAIWELNASVSGDKITPAQLDDIQSMIGDDRDYMIKVLSGIKKKFGVDALSDLPITAFQSVYTQVSKYAEERLAREMENNIPF